MSEPIKCFFVEPIGYENRYLRRYASSMGDGPDDGKCVKSKTGYHNAQTSIGRFEVTYSGEARETGHRSHISPKAIEYAGDSRWPQRCDCGYLFTAEDKWQVFTDEIYVDADGKEHSLRDNTPGMMWDAWWFLPSYGGIDGRSLCVITPDRWTWQIDGPCSNCTLPNDHIHKCWCRHGEVPNITVDKNPEPGQTTCNAGAGSIQTPNWHGFLTNGILAEQR